MKLKNILKIVLLLSLITILLSSTVKAFTVREWFDQSKNALDTGNANKNNKMDTTELKNASSILFNVLLGVGTGIAVIVGAILGLQFMQAGIDKKVQVKESLVAYVISCIVLFGSLGIWKLVVTIIGSIN